MCDRGFAGQDARDGEEARLQDRIGARAQADVAGDLRCVDDEKAKMLLDDLTLDRTGQMIPDLIRSPGAVEEKDGAGRRHAEHVVAGEEAELVAGDEACLGDEVGRFDRLRPEAQVRNRLGAGLVRIVDEVTLGIAAGILGDDLDAVLVGADGSIGAKAVEDGASDARGFDRERRIDGEAGVRQVVVDAEGESVPRREAPIPVALGDLVERGFHHGRGEILGCDAVTAADDARHRGTSAATEGLGEGGDDVEVKRFAGGTDLLGLLEDGDRSD